MLIYIFKKDAKIYGIRTLIYISLNHTHTHSHTYTIITRAILTLHEDANNSDGAMHTLRLVEKLMTTDIVTVINSRTTKYQESSSPKLFFMKEKRSTKS